ncbi:GntR family transcriptional regulator [Nesterenkonia aerolata]|uniref:GntR family transcriptional regulator n=1 Tax=Nesterenkonia aerolata TaxID=3074079 RepID=A0ABU2DRK1_9MICC|nr:GntR family transcriptional regulator [Nesterenkonia sp. LY-0111]MDR8019111.1 GntR family transcriptional regulator [Nesterenkonia sp. LY-0111]
MTKQSQVDHVYEQVRAQILDGSLAQGYDLNERTVAELVGTSRTPVREAVARLVKDGLAERESNRRTRVTVWDDERVGQLYEIRSLLEAEACRLAAMRRSENAVLRLEEALEQQRRLDSASPLARRDLNYEFHHEIWQASANPFLVEANTKYGVQSMCLTPTTLRSDERWAASLEEHSALVGHIAGHRAEEASALMRSHLESALRQR